MILETTFLVDVIREKPHAIAKARELQQRNEPQLIAAPSIHELWRGIAKKGYGEKQKQRMEEVIGGLTVLEMNAETAKRSGEIDGGLSRQGKTIDPEDCMIAGIALCHRQPVLTNDAHFTLIDGLQVERY